MDLYKDNMSLINLEKKINSELTTKINKTKIKHNQVYLETDKDHLIDICLFLICILSLKDIRCGDL